MALVSPWLHSQYSSCDLAVALGFCMLKYSVLFSPRNLPGFLEGEIITVCIGAVINGDFSINIGLHRGNEKR